MVEIIGFIASFFSVFSAVPQVIKSYKTKKTNDLSWGYFGMIVTGGILWLVYGILINSSPLVFTNLAALAFNCAILIMKFKYSSK
jgi:MtN3 and saliva related transmembrane protein